jgi:hypothetical protein
LTTTLTTSAATPVAAFACWAFGFSNALHHVRTRSFGGCLHHIATWRATRATPQGLTAHGNRLGLFTRFWTKAFQNLNRNFLLGKALDFHHEAFFVQAHQTHRFTTGACTSSAANAVHIVFRHIGDFVVHHVWQVFNVNAPSGNVGSNQNTDVATFESCQCLGAGCLAFIAMQSH